MNIKAAETLAKELMRKHWLLTWTFEWMNGVKQFGLCSPENIIKLSRQLVLVNDEPVVRDVILHEIAHALVGLRHGHDKVWKRKCIEIGAIPERCYTSSRVKEPDLRYVAICGACQVKHQRVKKPKQGAKIACRCQDGIRWERKVLLRYVDTKTVSISIKLP